MLIQSFENQSNLAEFFEHTDYYLVVVTRHKDNKRTEYKLQKTDYVYDMLKVKGSVTALVNCAKDLIVNFSYISPTVTTDNKSELVGVVDSAGEALSIPLDVTCSHCGEKYELEFSNDTCPACGSISLDNPDTRKKLVRLEKSIARRCERFTEALSPFVDKKIPFPPAKLFTKTDDPANYRHEVRYAPVDDDFDDIPF